MEPTRWKLLREILDNVNEVQEATNPWVHAAFQPAFSKASSIILLQKLDWESLSGFKTAIHTADSILANAESHGDILFNSDEVFGILYGIYDYIAEELMEMENSVEPEELGEDDGD